jgi:threonylcarbamoyladenosine tRNA methylthiotransferase MtaB
MVGFPGETEAEFEISSRFVRDQAFSRLHVFTYSARPGTVAAGMANQVDPRIKQARSQALHEIGQRAAHAFHETHLGRTMMVLWETQHPARDGESGAIWSGLTDTYVRAYAATERDLTNSLRLAKLVAPHEDGVWAELVDQGF